MKDNLKNIIGAEGYHIAKDGTVWSCRKRVGRGTGYGTTTILTDKWKKVKSYPDKNGYFKVVFHNQSKSINGATHRLLAQVYLPNPEGLPVVCHNDGDNQNNALSNLRWATQQENINDKWKHGTMFVRKGEDVPNSKLKEWQVVDIKRMIMSKTLFFREIANLYGVHEETIGHIARGKRWKHVLVPELIPL